MPKSVQTATGPPAAGGGGGSRITEIILCAYKMSQNAARLKKEHKRTQTTSTFFYPRGSMTVPGISKLRGICQTCTINQSTKQGKPWLEVYLRAHVCHLDNVSSFVTSCQQDSFVSHLVVFNFYL